MLREGERVINSGDAAAESEREANMSKGRYVGHRSSTLPGRNNHLLKEKRGTNARPQLIWGADFSCGAHASSSH